MVGYVLAYFFSELAFHRLPTGFMLFRVEHATFLPRNVSLTTWQNILAHLAVELAFNE